MTIINIILEIGVDFFISLLFRNFHHVRCDPFEKYCKPNRAVVFPSPKNHFVVIYGSRAMNNVMLVYLVRRTAMRVVIKIVNYAEIKALFVVIKIRHAVRTANI